ncbi:expressed unknown protein [Seminavis robusta]|uniref:Uncharacterized protein n=1 Tax=Seminavis robusta TaxID=568900 RepID=A0A9N8EM46_9STRA|nr:expressed unknown protein [Seminavis robusta]|eukprot:Sro1158_g247490.1 n/a (186) ;mRNA; r:19755-20312
MQNIDNSAEEEAVKDEAREFMTGLTGSGGGGDTPMGARSSKGAEIVGRWKAAYKNNESFSWDNDDMMWSSFWKMSYDEADSNENLEDTIAIVTTLLSQDGMKTPTMHANCFAVIHTLENLEIEGLFLFNGPDPEELFGANSETSWYTWSQLGPEATELVKNAVTELLRPVDGKLSGRAIKDTQVY